jgi:hypothetical protein
VAPDPQTARIVAFPDLKPATRRDLMRGEQGTEFEFGQRLFANFGDGTVLDYGDWDDRAMTEMLAKDGQSAAIEAVLTLPIRQASRAIEPAKGDNGEAEFCNSVLMAPHTSGGMKTPMQDVVGQITSSQIYRKAFFELVYGIRDTDGKVTLEKVAYRPSATCELKRDIKSGAMDGFRQQVYGFGGQLTAKPGKVPGYVEIPRVRSYVHINGKHRQPLTGTSEFDVAFWALAYNSEVQTPSGPVPIKDIMPGDYVFGVNGKPTPVLDVIPRGTRMMYRVGFKDGTSVECDADHLWGVYDAQRSPDFRYQVMSTADLLAAGVRRHGRAGRDHRFGVPRCEPVEYPARELPIDPYIMGAWLGDGSIRPDVHGVRRYAATLACEEPDIAGEVRRRLPSSMKLDQSNSNGKPIGDYHFRPVDAYRENAIRDGLVALGVNLKSPERFIPEIYLTASVSQRLDLLRGLMDTDGSIEKGISGGGNHSRYYTKSPRLAEDVQRLVRSLGGTAIPRAIADRTPRVEISTRECPFFLPRKANLWRRGGRLPAVKIVSIEPTEEKECLCITVGAEDGLFLTNDFIVTHNCHKTKLKVIFLWLQFLEQQSLPKVIVYGQDQREANARADDIASMRASGVAGFARGPQGAKDFEVLQSAGAGASQFADALAFLETWQTASVLAGFTGLSSLAAMGKGSLALSQDQSAFFLKSRQAISMEIAGSLTNDVIAPLVTLNFGPGASYPTFKFGALTDESSSQLVGLFQAMSVAPSLQVPPAILDLITERLATVLNLDVDAVTQIVQQGAKDREAHVVATAPPGMPKEAAASLGRLAGGTAAATRVAQQALTQAGREPLPENIAEPYSMPVLGIPKA